ncbi:uncharacterized protein LOC128870451 isoform X3 [Anastrepha ludens]|uniref:uncharacterized protein LOC128870451 isoform X3 n=1 Tax=Anastrepha ludens TaxID=28586 RepID=UPI0023B11D60|nr:uncharacterized protein LOC128870451 isoform X3 [Anastrepha ludens]XP_053969089.1 uncharacterized protein LOC128870451 isoform X3 [Anastrepha ludens]XP_053969090.1 uncharacterized protein LOC128870451 isoform X3 [Anastrepha ludens]
MIILRAGIESNPGPEVFYCCVSHKRLHPNSTSVRCNKCNGWSHLKTCSGLKSHREWSTRYVATCCSRQQASDASTATTPPDKPALPTATTTHTSTVRSPSEQHNSPSTPPLPSCSNPSAGTNQQLLVPRTVCSVCQTVIPRNLVSVQCNSCIGWCHFRRCSGLRTTREWTTAYVAPCCRALHPPSPPEARPPTTIRPQQPQWIAQQVQRRQPHASLTPRVTLTLSRSFKLLQFNCNGLTSKVDEIVNFMSRHCIKIVAVQETKLHARSSLITRDGYNVHRHERERDNGGGLAFIVHHNVQDRLIDEGIDRRDSTLECQGIAVRSGDSELEIFNIYIPLVTCCPAGYHPDIGALIRGENRLVVGDFNAHHDLWHSSLPNDRRGQQLAEQIDDSTFSTVNDDAPTRVVGNCSSSPDLTIASAGLINSITWRPMLSLASDHLPIIVSIERPANFVSANHRSYFNFKKANWAGFTEFTEDTFAALPIPTDVRVGERVFRKVLTAAAVRFIPAGGHKDIRPHFPAEAASLANERDHLRQVDPRDPRMRDLNFEIRQLVDQHKRTKWVEHLKTCNLTTGVSRLWSTVRSLSIPTKHNDKVAITFNGCTSSDPKRCAIYFSRLFIPHPLGD